MGLNARSSAKQCVTAREMLVVSCWWIPCSQSGQAGRWVWSGYLVGRTVMVKKILELLALKWLWDRRKRRR
jgi:hypothetical protein